LTNSLPRSVLYIGHVWPEPSSSAAGYRTIELINAFIENHFKVSFCSAATQNEFSDNLSNLRIDSYPIELNSHQFNELLAKLQPDIVIFDRFMTEEQYAWRVDEVVPNALKILDTIDLHFLRRTRQTAHKKYLHTSQNEIQLGLEHLNLQTEDAIREIAAILRCDLSLIISSFEYELLISHFNINPDLLTYCPFMLKHSETNSTDQVNVFEKRKDFIQIGNFLHAPNWDALLWTKQTLWPKIRKTLPQSECHIYGAYCSDKVKQLHDEKNGFLIKGRAYQLSDLMKKYRVNLAPLRFGAGIKGKIADGYINGLPNVTTSIGAEGMCGTLNWGGIIADNANSFIEGAIILYQNKLKWTKAQQDGFKCIATIHNETKVKSELISKVNQIFYQLKAHRQANFLGTMLNYHTNQRTKYMSRWIEEKNKNQMD